MSEEQVTDIQKVFSGYRAVIVTENESIGAVLTKAFENRGGEVEVFSNGKLAIESGQKRKIHVLVVSEDVCYHNADWCAKEIRFKKIIDVDVMWYIGKRSVDRMDGWIRRPFRPIELLKPIYSKLKSARIEKEKRKLHSAGKVLVLDDEEELQDLAELVLTRDGYKVIKASHGIEGLKQVEENPDILCALVDLKMPKMDGLEFVRAVRSRKALEKAALIMVTANASKESIQEGASLRIDSWISKPYTNSHLIEKVRGFIEQKQTMEQVS